MISNLRLLAAPLLLMTGVIADASQRAPALQSTRPATASTDSSRVVDSFESVSQWTTNPAQGVEVTVHPDSGLHGRAMRVDFDFHGHPGYWIVRRNVSIDLPLNYEFRFALRASSPTNNLEFKLIDETNANVWWSRNLNFDFPAQWQTLARRKRQICFAWGPSPGFDIHHVAAIEFAISTGSGGKGSLWIDELSLTPLREESPFDVVDPVASNPIVGSWESAALSPDGSGASLDFAADGTFASTFGIMGSFDYTFAKDRLTYKITPINTGKPEEHTIPIRIHRDTLVQAGMSVIGKDVTMKRLRPATASDDVIVGEWEAIDAPEFVAFGENGKARLRLPMRSCSGTWTAANGHVAVNLNGEIAGRDYSIENDVMTVRDSGREFRYNRRTRTR